MLEEIGKNIKGETVWIVYPDGANKLSGLQKYMILYGNRIPPDKKERNE